MEKAKTSTGFSYEFDTRIMDDLRMFQTVRILNGDYPAEEKANAMLAIGELILGNKTGKLEDHIKGLNDGFVPAKEYFRECGEIFKEVSEKSKELKNS